MAYFKLQKLILYVDKTRKKKKKKKKKNELPFYVCVWLLCHNKFSLFFFSEDYATCSKKQVQQSNKQKLFSFKTIAHGLKSFGSKYE
jgi:hypothetical protein